MPPSRAAIVSISVNPLLYRAVGPVERWAERRPRLWRLLTACARKAGEVKIDAGFHVAAQAWREKRKKPAGGGPGAVRGAYFCASTYLASDCASASALQIWV